MILQLEGIVRSLGGREVLRGVSLSCASGEVVGLVGQNGAGKSTLLRVVAGVLAPDAGRVLLDGEAVGPSSPALRRRLGYLADGAEPAPHLTPREIVELVALLKGVPNPGGPLLERVGVDAAADVRFGLLSVGQRRRTQLAAALVGDPWLLVLDEPTAGLDPDGLAFLTATLRAHRGRGGAALVASHEPAFLDDVVARRVRLEAGLVGR